MIIYNCSLYSEIKKEKLVGKKNLYFLWKKSHSYNYDFTIINAKKNNGYILGKCTFSRSEDYTILDNVFDNVNKILDSKWCYEITDGNTKVTNYTEYPDLYNCNVYRLKVYLKNTNLLNDLSIVDKIILRKYVKNKAEKISKETIKTIWKNENIIETKNYIRNNFLELELFPHQKKSVNWMIDIERLVSEKKAIKVDRCICLDNNENIKYDLLDKKIIENNKNTKSKIYISGGILADETGMGKTISMIALISHNYKKSKYVLENGLINTNQTIIVCPPQLCLQWGKEIKKTNKKLKYLIITGKISHRNLTLKLISKYDIIITTPKVLTNRKYYANLKKDKTIESTTSYALLTKKLESRIDYLTNWEDMNIDDISNSSVPVLFELFKWERLIIDEGHEIYDGNKINHAENVYLRNWFRFLKTKYRWYVSGTAFNNPKGFKGALELLNFRLEISQKIPSINSNLIKCLLSYDQVKENDIDEINFIKVLAKKLYFRTCKSDIFKINLTETVHMITLSEPEFNVYERQKLNGCHKLTLQKLCCHYKMYDSTFEDVSIKELSIENISEEFKKVNDREINNLYVELEHQYNLLLDVGEILSNNNSQLFFEDDNIDLQASNILNSNISLDLDDSRIRLLKKKEKIISSKIKSLKTKISYLEKNEKWKKIDLNNKSCAICREENERNRIVTFCGHFYCKDCILSWFKRKKNCPICRESLNTEKIFQFNSQNKYGSKLTKLMKLCNEILLKKGKILIFSQWDELLKMIGKILNQMKIKNIFIKGHINTRERMIEQFNNNKVNIIMLTPKFSAVGVNLIKADNIIFVDPIDDIYDNIKKIEDQIIGRSYRLTQKNNIHIHRLITKKTVEEDIHKKKLLSQQN